MVGCLRSPLRHMFLSVDELCGTGFFLLFRDCLVCALCEFAEVVDHGDKCDAG